MDPDAGRPSKDTGKSADEAPSKQKQQQRKQDQDQPPVLSLDKERRPHQNAKPNQDRQDSRDKKIGQYGQCRETGMPDLFRLARGADRVDHHPGRSYTTLQDLKITVLHTE